jgi:hypothetical protein
MRRTGSPPDQRDTSMFDFDRQDILESDAVMASQFFTPRPGLPGPEHSLFVAVLEEATRCLLNYCASTDREKHGLYKDAERWFLSTDDMELFTFESVCTVLSIDASSLRRRLLARRDRAKRGDPGATRLERRGRRASTPAPPPSSDARADTPEYQHRASSHRSPAPSFHQSTASTSRSSVPRS